LAGRERRGGRKGREEGEGGRGRRERERRGSFRLCERTKETTNLFPQHFSLAVQSSNTGW